VENNEELVIEGIDEGMMVEGDNLAERVFKVGELVEYWAGAFVRGYQTSGEPAFVKRVEGGGKYAIKMIGSGRGKYRQVDWRQMFKDGAFNKLKGDRIQEKATVAAEAKLGGELRQTRRELQMAGKIHKEKEKEADKKVQRLLLESRKELKDLTVGHKRQLEQMEEDTRQGMQTLREGEEEKARETRQCIRYLRQELRDLTEELGREKEGQA
jgi:hypothetical protein